MTMEPSGGVQIQVVNPGDPNSDPFTDPNKAAGTGGTPAATQVMDPPASQPVVTQTTVPQATPAASPPASSDPAKAAPVIAPELEALIQSRVSQAHSTLDKKINTLTKAVQDKDAEIERVRTEGLEAVRRAQLEGMPEHERQAMQQAWQAEDRQNALVAREKAVTDFYKNVEGLRLLSTYSAHGVTEEDILGYTGDPTEMEAHIKALAFDRLQEGGATAAQAAGVVQAAARSAPAGTNLPQDLGNTPAPTGEPQILSGQSLGDMAQNIKNMFSTGPNIPWSP